MTRWRPFYLPAIVALLCWIKLLASTPPPHVSVVIPVYNRARSIIAAVASAQAQTMRDLEIIVVDDGSTDGTQDAVAAIEDPRIRLIAHETNRGAAAARNTAIRASRGDFIAFLDSDDTWVAEKLAVQLALMEKAGPRHDVCCSGVSLHLLDHGVTRLVRPQSPASWNHEIALGCELSPGSTQLTRRAAFERVGLMDEALPRFEDWDWLFRYTREREIVLAPEPLADIYNRRGRMGDAVALSTERYFAKHATEYAALPDPIRRKAVADAWLQVVANYGFEGRFRDCVRPFWQAFQIRPVISTLRAFRGVFYVVRGRLMARG